ncbi:HD domain-containing phosphohydrolase [Sneathiella chinensis]|uniref:HD-GYP domain-containing protein n=1 Tax=Sneathiella chinensis TaxID=349750 RepID=A0ABQ5TY54_9PROT|nr:HD domain-containing phosphohydrolase [Sneathiella chinensis]GLQ04793.1 hypothetical protein GCM10007924_00140 [Sneathiella chinensis]
MKLSLKTSILLAIVLLILTFGLASTFVTYRTGVLAAEETAATVFEEAVERAYANVNNKLSILLQSALYGSLLQDAHAKTTSGQEGDILLPLTAILENNPDFQSAFFGFRDGGFYQVLNAPLATPILRDLAPPPGTRWAVYQIRITPGSGARTVRWSFLDPALTELARRDGPDNGFDPRSRPWFQQAQKSNTPTLSSAYQFYALNRQGMTASHRMGDSGHVFGIDFSLQSLSDFIQKTPVSRSGGLILFDSTQRLLAVNRTLVPQTGKLTFPAALPDIQVGLFRTLMADHGQGWAEKIDFLGTPSMWRVKYWAGGGGQSIGIAVLAPFSDFTPRLGAITRDILLANLLIFLLISPFAYFYSSRIATFVSKLAADAERVRTLIFDKTAPPPSRIREFSALGHSFTHMKTSLRDNTAALEKTQAKLSRLVELGIAMTAEQDIHKLMSMILNGAAEIANADGATLFMLNAQKDLQVRIIRNGTLGLSFETDQEKTPKFPPVPLYLEDGTPNNQNIASFCVLSGKTTNIHDAYDQTRYDFSRARALDEQYNYRSVSFLSVPLKPKDGDILGALQLVNALDPETGEIIPFDEDIQQFVEALSAQAATALHNHQLAAELEQLVEAMIRLLAGAIDTKSPYTGAHCARVPVLARMLAEAASRSEQGTLADFRFTTDKEWREFRIGTWLHDCGKVSTPEYVVDKATKLETLYDRIHEIRTRFEVLRRDAEVSLLKAHLTPDTLKTVEAELAPLAAELSRDFEFVARCNLGGEFMEDEKTVRLKEIAERTWLRHFDNRLGLGHEELGRCPDTDPTLPAAEPLLSDRPEHLVPSSRDPNDLYAGYGFNIPIPEHLYNRGELYNLSVARGTLTKEERFKINEHIMQTIAMLEQLPWPSHLKRVPEYAGTHHETLDGTGYPRGLTGAALSIPARITAIADIFEALTASDRPYKKAKTLSESLRILHSFKQRGAIDPELFDLFLTSGVYLDYARMFLSPDQIDAVDTTPYLDRADNAT